MNTLSSKSPSAEFTRVLYVHKPAEALFCSKLPNILFSYPVKTNYVLTVRKALNTGQLVKDDFFTLFESVGALEVLQT